MRTYKTTMIHKATRHLSAVRLTVLAVVLGSIVAKAGTVNVTFDPNQVWNGYYNLYTNGLVNTVWPAYHSAWLGQGTSFANQSSIDGSGTVTIAPDISSDQNYPMDTLIWADASGTSPAISKVISDFYADSTTIASGGDTVVFSGTLATNNLSLPYTNNALVFIKEYDSSFGFIGMSSVYLNTLTNGQGFSVTYGPIGTSGNHVQWGLEWAGPPARSSTVASLGSAVLTTNGSTVVVAGPTNIYVYIDPSQAWAGYRSTTPYYGPASGYLGVGGQTPQLQGTISSLGIVQCAPDISLDINFHTDTSIWSDASGISAGIGSVDNTFYVDSTSTGAKDGDTVIFTGTLVTNALTEPNMAGSIVAFIKDFSSGWSYHGESTVYLNTLTNGEQFTISKVIAGAGDHVQWGFEWVAPPARTNETSPAYVGQYGYVLLSSNNVVATGPQILSINPSLANVILGSNQTFMSLATGSGLSYQWLINGVNLTNGPGVSGATASTLTLTGIQCTQEGKIGLIITDSGNLKATNQVTMVVCNPSWLYYDRALAPFNGYINVWNGANLIASPPSSGVAGTAPAASFGFGVTPTSLLRASMNTSNDLITLRPNTYVYDGATNALDPAYINPDGSAAAYLEQDYFISDDALAGQTLTFAGYCSSNSLNAKYTARAWIKDGAPDWSVEHRYDAPLVAGKPFTFTVTTTPGDHIQYGFGLWGPDNSGTNPITQGLVEVKVYSPLTAAHSAGNVDLAFPTVINHNYTVQYKTNLTDGTWRILNTTNGTGTTIKVPESTGSAKSRFYRLSTQ